MMCWIILSSNLLLSLLMLFAWQQEAQQRERGGKKLFNSKIQFSIVGSEFGDIMFSSASVSPSLKSGHNKVIQTRQSSEIEGDSDMTLTLEPKPGDLIKIYREVYQHWGVYVGEDASIVHLVNDGRVLKEKLWNVVEKNDWTVNNSLDRNYKPRDVDVIVKEANAMEGKTLNYSVTSYNCEHFANEMRYGKAESLQVQEAKGLGTTIVAAGGVMALACMALNKPY